MKIYRPMLRADDGTPIMVEEERDMMNDTSNRCIMLDELEEKLKWLEDRNKVIKDKALSILMPKDKKKWDKKDAEYVKAVIDVTSARWIEQIGKIL